jgi:hypothetical protein
MSDAPRHEAHRRPHTPPMADPFMEFDLPADIHRLQAETTWNTGQNARTLIKYDDFRVVLIALAAEARMREHKAEGPSTRSCVANGPDDHLTDFPQPQHRARNRGTEQPILCAQTHSAEWALKEWRVDDGKLQQE